MDYESGCRRRSWSDHTFLHGRDEGAALSARALCDEHGAAGVVLLCRALDITDASARIQDDLRPERQGASAAVSMHTAGSARTLHTVAGRTQEARARVTGRAREIFFLWSLALVMLFVAGYSHLTRDDAPMQLASEESYQPSKWEERILELDRQAIEEAYKDYLGKLYS